MTERTPVTNRAAAAQGSKIAAAGLGLAGMFGLVAVMGFSSRTSASTPPEPVGSVPQARVVVVLHPAAGAVGSSTSPGDPAVVAPTPGQPVVLTAQPTVRQAPAAAAPAGKTNGSR